MLSRETENKLAEVFLRISSAEQQVESCRLALSSNLDFDVYTAFRAVDRLGLGSLSSADLVFFLDKHHHYSTADEVYLSIKQYDTNQNGRLSLEEFSQLVLPSTDPSLKSLAQTRRGFFSTEVEYHFVRLLQSEVSFHRAVENARKQLNLRYDYSPLECFKLVDIRGVSYVDRLTLLDFLRRFRYVGEEEVDSVFRRIDNDGDNLLTYKEFVDSITPLQSNLSMYRSVSPSREFSATSSFRRTSPLRNSSPVRDGFRQSAYNSSYLSPRRSSPLRNSSPLRESQSSSFLRKSLYNPGESLQNSVLSSHSLQASQTRKSSPLRTSSPTRDSLYRTSPLRNSTLNVSSRSFNQSGANSSIRHSSPLRKSSPLRQSSPSRVLSPSRTLNESQSLSRSLRSRENPSIEENELVSWFQDEIRMSREIERKKNDLALRHDFNLIDAFRVFDKHDFGYVTLSDLEDSFRNLGFYSTTDEVYLLIKHFSHLQNSRLSFADFSELFSPKQDEYSRILRNRNALNVSYNERLRVFSRETLELFLATFRLIFDAETLAERVRQRLSRMPEFSLHQAFVAVDKDRNGFITIDEFQNILNAHGIFATGKDLQILLEKYDKNRDGRVTYSEFVEEVTPKSPRRF